MLILPASLEHLDAIHALEYACFSDAWTRNDFIEELNNKHTVPFVALDAAPVPSLIGYTFMRHTVNEGHIGTIAVAPEYRGKGVGSLLMDALINAAYERGMIGIALEVRQGNRPAMSLYHKYGFIVEGYRKDFYRDPSEDAVLMWKDIKY
ncbi:MAG: ribosomal protein S18-alanine N-acetyltransferase [Defluviitaleaceae bacterium]|nr:ribosomal protein S18-alanine N-acetyltransferase [Defluviitaleaceae bacterium]